MLQQGSCLLISTPQTDNPHSMHFFIIILEFNQITGETIIVPVCTKRKPGLDTTIFNVNDHPWISKQSYVDYSLAYITSQSKLDQLVSNKDARELDSLNPQSLIFKKIQAGILKSKETKEKVREYYLDYIFDKM